MVECEKEVAALEFSLLFWDYELHSLVERRTIRVVVDTAPVDTRQHTLRPASPDQALDRGSSVHEAADLDLDVLGTLLAVLAEVTPGQSDVKVVPLRNFNIAAI